MAKDVELPGDGSPDSLNVDGWHLDAVLDRVGVSGRELARRLGDIEKARAVRRWRNHEVIPSWHAAIEIADALDVSLDELAGRATPPRDRPTKVGKGDALAPIGQRDGKAPSPEKE